ncbi:MAG TPA: hypothetical protein VFC54_14915 [Pseudolabrys sp.]|nr:hypothetical protein [Pseudolabrys sp.]
MVRSVCIAAIVAGGVVACSPVPRFNVDPRISPSDVASRVQCELKLASENPANESLKLNTYIVSYSLGLKVESDVNPNVKADWVIPYHLTDTFNPSPSAGIEDYVLRDSSTKYSVSIANLTDYQCPHYLAAAYREDVDAARVSYGSFGIMDWLSQTSESAKSSPVAPSLDYYTVKFAVTGTANPTPGFKIVNLMGTINLALKRIDTNTLNIVFVKDKPAKPQEVCVTNLPNATECKPLPSAIVKPKAPIASSKKRELQNLNATPPRTAKPKQPERIPSDVQDRLDKKLENLQLRDILRP